MRQLLLGLAGAVMLAACSSGEGANDSSEGRALSGGGQDQPAPSNLYDDPQNAVVPVTLPSPKPVTSIPAAFQGRWGMVVQDCDPARSDAKGRMVVGPSSLTFYEARATPSAIALAEPFKLMARLDYVGEGRHWQRQTTLTLVNDDTLVRQEQNPADSFRYSRCPAS